MPTLSALLLLVLTTTSALAENVAPPPDVTPVPDGPPGLVSTPPVTIKQTSKGRVEEYRANGRIYMLKVTPKIGKPYYLLDRKGDGTFARSDTLDGGLQPPMWVIKKF
jgi:hypothetical protein